MSLAKGVPYVNYFQADGGVTDVFGEGGPLCKLFQRSGGRVIDVFGEGGPLCKLFQGQTAGSLMSLVKGVPYVNYFKIRRKGH